MDDIKIYREKLFIENPSKSKYENKKAYYTKFCPDYIPCLKQDGTIDKKILRKIHRKLEVSLLQKYGHK